MKVVKIITADKIQGVFPTPVSRWLNGYKDMNVCFIPFPDKTDKVNFSPYVGHIALMAIYENSGRLLNSPWKSFLGLGKNHQKQITSYRHKPPKVIFHDRSPYEQVQ